jgi:hypothetical protein
MTPFFWNNLWLGLVAQYGQACCDRHRIWIERAAELRYAWHNQDSEKAMEYPA